MRVLLLIPGPAHDLRCARSAACGRRRSRGTQECPVGSGPRSGRSSTRRRGETETVDMGGARYLPADPPSAGRPPSRGWRRRAWRATDLPRGPVALASPSRRRGEHSAPKHPARTVGKLALGSSRGTALRPAPRLLGSRGGPTTERQLTTPRPDSLPGLRHGRGVGGVDPSAAGGAPMRCSVNGRTCCSSGSPTGHGRSAHRDGVRVMTLAARRHARMA
ncbi:hypothetical protein B2J93_2384 [Marssonina coronariae]|uniref:Uncharacterized protein n=1 Tax=Diplocarpon coronariae TaxID=2795749 RepID=A0A218YT41_9HELO|nr:hypothetical protein B2J93_2384 [Marssonina coronariae]